MINFYPSTHWPWSSYLTMVLMVLFFTHVKGQSFNASGLAGENISNPTSLEFGPNGKLYVSQQNGLIMEYSIVRDAAPAGSGSYSVTATSIIDDVMIGVPNHNDDGTISTLTSRQVTGLLTAGTATNPVLYISSSDSRIGGGPAGNDSNLDTNSGVLSRLTWTGSDWDKVDLVRGLPRCEENHAVNGMDSFQIGNNMFILLQVGGNANKGAPSNNFGGTQETYLSGALLIINITQLEQMEQANGGPYIDNRHGALQYIYDLPTLNDPERPDIDNSSPNFPYQVGHPMYNATIDLGDPFGGNDGLNQAFPEADGPVQIFSPGYRNAYDVVITANGQIYTSDNGGNTDWGGLPVIYTGTNVRKGDESTTTYNPGAGDYITNEFNESGSNTVGDALHYVGTINDANGTYYGGHPVPIRAFPSRAGVVKHIFDGSEWVLESSYNFQDLLVGSSGYFNGSFTISDFPDDSDQGFFLVGAIGDSRVHIFDMVNVSTNGICEYTATNFGGAMRGDILTASFGGWINRYQLNATGDGLVAQDNGFLLGFGNAPLDVIAQGDSDPFPGTIWALTYSSKNITVFEPTDFGNCPQPGDPDYDPLEDSDFDGYTNGDEVDNGTNHCSGGSKPNDNDLDFISDLNDPDDDNDGIPDVTDAFATDADNGTTTNLPVSYSFWNNDPGTGFAGLGFTGWMTNGTTDYLDQYDPVNLSFGGAGGKATLDAVGEGDAFGSFNNQENGFQFGVNVDSNSPPFTVHTEIENPFSGLPPVDFQSIGVYIGNGDQDNYLKVVIMDGTTNGDGIDGFEITLEENGSPNTSIYDVSGLLAATAVDIYFGVDPAANTAQPFYSLNGGISVVALGPPITLPIDFLDPSDNQGMAIGIISTSIGPGPEFPATWDFINVTVDQPSNIALDPDPIDFGTLAVNSGVAQLNITANNNGSPASGSIAITDITITGSDAALFSNSTVLPVQIGPGSELVLQLNFTPDSNAGIKTANMVVTHTGPNSPTIVPITAELTNQVLGINTGGGQTTHSGNIFGSDQYFVGGSAWQNTAATSLPLIYQTERHAPSHTFAYNIPIANGDYTVLLHFAEIYWGATGGGTGGVGSRIFDVAIEGELVLDNYDIYADVGPEIPVTKSFSASVTDGELNINFSSLTEVGGADQPKVSAIEVIGGTSQFPPITVDPIADQISLVGDVANLGISASGGDPGENFSYSISGQPLGIDIEPTNGMIFGTIANGALNGGPHADGFHQVTVAADKPGSISQTQMFSWTVGPTSVNWVDKDENENYTGRHECSFVQAGNKFYLMGGRENAKTLDVYDYTSDSWTALGDLAPVEFNHYQAAEYQGLIWVIGAFKDNDFPNEAPADHIWAFDPAAQEWIQGPEIPESRKRGSSGLVVYNDKFYIVAGNTDGHDGGYVAWVDEYDPATGIWTILSDAPRARDHFHAAVIGNNLYAVGGRLSGGTGGSFKPVIPEVDVFDFSAGTWSTLPSGQNLPTPRAAAGTVNFNNKLVVIGGEVENELVYGVNMDDALKITEEYDPATGIWTRLADMNFDRHGTQAIVSGGGIFVTAGSPNKGGGNQKNMEYLGSPNPSGVASVASVLSGPASVHINASSPAGLSLNVSGGNQGIFIRSLEITGLDASDFNIEAGDLVNSLIKTNSQHNLVIAYNSSQDGATANLVVNYGASAQLIFPLSGGSGSVENGVTSFTLVNANTDTDIFTLSEGLTIDAATVQGIPLNIRANTNPAIVGSVFLSLTGPVGNSRTESAAPYALFGDTGGNYTGNLLSDGNYTMNATAYSGSGLSGTNLGSLTVQFSISNQGGNIPPTAVASGNADAVAPFLVNFSSAGSNDPDGSIVSFSWDFGDGNSSSLANPSHTYAAGGNYTVSLMVTDNAGAPASTSIQVQSIDPTVNQPPTAVAGGTPTSGLAPLGVNFTSAGSQDPDGSIASYSWDFGDGVGTAIQPNPSYTYNSPGNYTAMLTVTDNNGDPGSDTVIINVQDPTTNGVASFTLVDADFDTDLFNLTEGMQIDVNDIQDTGLNIRANTNPAIVGSVFLSLTGPVGNSRTESVAPYALFGDVSGNYNALQLPLGNYTISATAYSGGNLSGTNLGSLTFQFSIIGPGTSKGLETTDLSLEENDPISTGTQSFDQLEIFSFPNPASSELNIRISNPRVNLSGIYIYDIGSRLVKSIEANLLKISDDLYQIIVSGLEDGVYFVNLRTDEGSIFGFELIVKK